MHITDWETHRKKLLKNPRVRKALKENELELKRNNSTTQYILQ